MTSQDFIHFDMPSLLVIKTDSQSVKSLSLTSSRSQVITVHRQNFFTWIHVKKTFIWISGEEILSVYRCMLERDIMETWTLISRDEKCYAPWNLWDYMIFLVFGMTVSIGQGFHLTLDFWSQIIFSLKHGLSKHVKYTCPFKPRSPN